jgi:propionate CoA-transferase
LTAGGLKVAVEGGQLRIVAEGHSRKIVEAVSHLSFNAAHIARKHTPVLYITERAVFETRLDEAGVRRLTLVEIAPGIDLQRDVLDRCDTTVAVAPELQTMDARVFAAGPFRLT